jgi:pimeloyl-ACP methyl ester carboxylesterase
MAETQTITLPDGRTLSYGIYGAPTPAASLTIFYFHGFPASHHEAAAFGDAARARNIRIIAPDRPGMGLSTFQPARAITDWSADVLFLADHAAIRADTFAVLGISGGSPYVLACCAAIPDTRLKAAGIISGLYPVSLGLKGMLMEPRLLLWLAPWATTLVEKVLDWGIVSSARDETDPDKLERLMNDSMRERPEPDKRAWEEDEGGLREMLVASVRHAFQDGGAKGAAWEARLFGSPWGFELADVKMGEGKLVLWHGDKDLNSPLAMAEKAHALLQGSELRLGRGEAHMSLLLHKLQEALDTLKEGVA